MIFIKSKREIEHMRKAGRITAQARTIARQMIEPGATTKQIDKEVHKFITMSKAVPSFLGYGGFPASVCISINDEVIHGIPGDRVIHEGDIVSVDVGAYIDGYHGDCAGSYIAGQGSDIAEKLVSATRQSFFEAMAFARLGCRISDISHAVESYCNTQGFSVVREYVGHGVGTKLHEGPEVPNFGKPGHGPRLAEGMTIAVEPMVNEGGAHIRVLSDDWTVVTADGSLSAHYENTILITDGEPEILTMAEDI